MDFVSFTPDYWDGPRHNRHYFCLELAKHHKVLFVSPPISLERLLTQDKSRPLPGSTTEMVAENLWTHVPSKWLFTNLRLRWLDRLFRYLRLRLLKRKLRQLGFTDPVLLVWHPQYLDMLDAFKGCPAIYYIYDHLSGYSGNDPTKRWDQELELIRRSDMVFALSRKLVEENRPYNDKIFLLPNAVDYEHFSKATRPETKIPVELELIPHPRIGYVGSINEKVDVELLQYLATERPAWSIVLIGRQNFASSTAKGKFDELIARKNVHWIPYRKPEVLPAYLKGLDICLMCYVINGWTYFGDPSKMHEYLASGKPTIGAPLPAILEFSDIVDVPNNHEEWVAAVTKGLKFQSAAVIERRILTARDNSYAKRIQVALTLIRENLGRG